jgi:hypothetical protein
MPNPDLRAQLRHLVDEVIRPNAEKTDRTGEFPRENLRALARSGWNSVLAPKELGGLALGHDAFALAAEEIGRACASTALVYVMHIGALQTVLLFGNDDQKQRWVKTAREGLIGTYSTSEKASGGHWWFNFSQAKRDGENYLLNAEKSFTTSSGQADYYVLQTRSPDAKGATDITFFIVDGKAPGISAGPWEALGVHGNHSGPIKYENVRVARRDRLGSEGQGKEIIYHGVSPVYLIGLGAAWHGVARGALELGVSDTPFEIHGVMVSQFDLFAAATASVLVVLLTLLFKRTRIGLALRAVAADPLAALSIGVDLRRVWAVVWAVAGAVALVAGLLWGARVGVQFSLSLILLKALPVLIIGGFSSITGAIVGGLLVGSTEKLAEVYIGPRFGGGIENWFPYVLALLFLLVRPTGLFGEPRVERV